MPVLGCGFPYTLPHTLPPLPDLTTAHFTIYHLFFALRFYLYYARSLRLHILLPPRLRLLPFAGLPALLLPAVFTPHYGLFYTAYPRFYRTHTHCTHTHAATTARLRWLLYVLGYGSRCRFALDYVYYLPARFTLVVAIAHLLPRAHALRLLPVATAFVFLVGCRYYNTHIDYSLCYICTHTFIYTHTFGCFMDLVLVPLPCGHSDLPFTHYLPFIFAPLYTRTPFVVQFLPHLYLHVGLHC